MLARINCRLLIAISIAFGWHAQSDGRDGRGRWAWELWQMSLAIHHALRTSERATQYTERRATLLRIHFNDGFK